MRCQEIYFNLLSQRQEVFENEIKSLKKDINGIGNQLSEVQKTLATLVFVQKENQDKFNLLLASLKPSDVNVNVTGNPLSSPTPSTSTEVFKTPPMEKQEVKTEFDPNPGYFCLSGSPVVQPVPELDGNADDDEAGNDPDSSVRIVRFFDITKDMAFRQLQAQKYLDIRKQLPSPRSLDKGVKPFSVSAKKALLDGLKSGMSETVVGPPISDTEFVKLYPEFKKTGYNPKWTKLSDFSEAGRRNSLKTYLTNDFELGTIQEEHNPKAKRKRSNTQAEGNKPKRSKKVIRIAVEDNDEDSSPVPDSDNEAEEVPEQERWRYANYGEPDGEELEQLNVARIDGRGSASLENPEQDDEDFELPTKRRHPKSLSGVEIKSGRKGKPKK